MSQQGGPILGSDDVLVNVIVAHGGGEALRVAQTIFSCGALDIILEPPEVKILRSAEYRMQVIGPLVDGKRVLREAKLNGGHLAENFRQRNICRQLGMGSLHHGVEAYSNWHQDACVLELSGEEALHPEQMVLSRSALYQRAREQSHPEGWQAHRARAFGKTFLQPMGGFTATLQNAVCCFQEAPIGGPQSIVPLVRLFSRVPVAPAPLEPPPIGL